MFAALIRRAYLSDSCLTYALNSSGVEPETMNPCSPRLLATCSDFNAFAASRWIFETSSGRLFPGPPQPDPRTHPEPCRPDSATVGTSGSGGKRPALVTAIGRRLPPLN